MDESLHISLKQIRIGDDLLHGLSHKEKPAKLIFSPDQLVLVLELVRGLFVVVVGALEDVKHLGDRWLPSSFNSKVLLFL